MSDPEAIDFWQPEDEISDSTPCVVKGSAMFDILYGQVSENFGVAREQTPFLIKLYLMNSTTYEVSVVRSLKGYSLPDGSPADPDEANEQAA